MLSKKAAVKETAGTATASIEELAKIVKENEARVEQQRKDIYYKQFELQDMLQAPTKVEPGKIDSFNVTEIEQKASGTKSRENIIMEIRAMEMALEKPACCDREFLNAIREYLEAVRPVVEKAEGEEWEIIRQIQEATQRIQSLTGEYYKTHDRVTDLLRVAHLSLPIFIGEVYDKLVASQTINGFSNLHSLVEYVDTALARCDDGEKYNVLAHFPITVTATASAAPAFFVAPSESAMSVPPMPPATAIHTAHTSPRR